MNNYLLSIDPSIKNTGFTLWKPICKHNKSWNEECNILIDKECLPNSAIPVLILSYDFNKYQYYDFIEEIIEPLTLKASEDDSHYKWSKYRYWVEDFVVVIERGFNNNLNARSSEKMQALRGHIFSLLYQYYIPENLTIEVNIPQIPIFTHTQDKLIWDYNSWVENVVPKIKPLEININFKDYLDPTLLINTFNDLKRYYKSVDVYLSYKYETEEWFNLELSSCSTTENFNPSKSQTFVFSKELNELSIYNQPLKLKYYEYNKITYQGYHQGLYAGYWGNGKIGLEIDRNEYNLYSIENTYMQSKIDDYIVAQSIENQKDTLLGFCNFYDKEFNLIVQLFPNIMQLELAVFSEKDTLRPITQYIRYYKYYKLIISKIVFNPR